MKKLLFAIVTLAFVALPLSSRASDEAVFTVTSTKTNYAVGDDIQVTLNVDAGPYASTLSVIDFDLKVSDTSIIEVEDSSAPFVPGSIYSTAGIQGVDGDIINAVTYINASDKPTNRSGTIGTINFKALKEGTVTLSYDRIEAAEEGDEDNYVSTSASSLTITIGSTVSAYSSTSKTSTPTVRAVTTTATDTSTGPEEVFLFSAAGGIAIFVFYKARSMKGRRT